MATSTDYSKLIMPEEVGCEVNTLICHDKHDIIQVSRVENARLVRLTQFAAVVALLLSCTALFINAYQHRAANNQQCPGGTDPIVGSQPQQQQRVQNSPSAHLTAPSKLNNSEFKYLNWEAHLGRAHLSEFTYQDGDLIVPKDGMYKVYLQITFRMPGGSRCGDEVLISQTVMLFAVNYPEDKELITTSDTVYCKKQTDTVVARSSSVDTQYWQKSPYTSGVFKLKAGDKLRVLKGYRYQEMMLLREDMTFFGAHLV